MLRAGLRCTAVNRFHHRFRGTVDQASGPLELAWENDSVTAFDVGSDWTLEITENPWSDPFANASPDHLRDLEDEVGVWVRTVNAEEPLATLIGQTLLSATPARNDQGDLVGARLNFDTTTLRVSAHGGNLLALVE